VRIKANCPVGQSMPRLQARRRWLPVWRPATCISPDPKWPVDWTQTVQRSAGWPGGCVEMRNWWKMSKRFWGCSSLKEVNDETTSPDPPFLV